MAAPPTRPAARSRAAPARSRSSARTPAIPTGNGAEANRRGEIVRVAARLFREKGYDGTTVRDIAAAVGMRSGSPFYHFAAKEEILFAVMEEGLRQGLARSEAVLARHAEPRQRFGALVREHFGTILEDGSDFVPVMLYEWRRLPPAYRRRLIAVKDRYDALWQGVIADLARAGLLRGDVKLARLLILGAVNFTATWFRGDGPLSLDELARASADFFVAPASSQARTRRRATAP